MQAELAQREHLEQLLQRAEAAGQRDEAVRARIHFRFALP